MIDNFDVSVFRAVIQKWLQQPEVKALAVYDDYEIANQLLQNYADTARF